MTSIDLDLKPSKSLFFIVFLSHILAGMAVYCTDSSFALQLMLYLLVTLSCYWNCWQKILQLSSRVIVRCSFSAGQWELTDALGRCYVAKLQSNNLVTNVVVIMRFRVLGNWRCNSLILFHDSVEAKAFRRLRVLLLHGL
jgi:hypothetical protein